MTQLELPFGGKGGNVRPRYRAGKRVPFRLFFATMPPEEIAREAAGHVSDVCAARGLRGKFLAVRRYHISQLLVGEYRDEPTAVIASVKTVLARASLPQFDVQLDRLLSFGRTSTAWPAFNKPLVLVGHDSMVALRSFNNLLRALFKLPTLPPGAVPHMTTFYGEHNLDVRLPRPISWRARDLTLILNAGGEYRRAGSWPLRR